MQKANYEYQGGPWRSGVGLWLEDGVLWYAGCESCVIRHYLIVRPSPSRVWIVLVWDILGGKSYNKQLALYIWFFHFLFRTQFFRNDPWRGRHRSYYRSVVQLLLAEIFSSNLELIVPWVNWYHCLSAGMPTCVLCKELVVICRVIVTLYIPD